MRTWDGNCGTVIAQFIFEKRERRSSAWNRQRREAKIQEMKIERTAPAAAGPARHNTTCPPLPTRQPAATARRRLGARGRDRAAALPTHRPLRRFLRVLRDKAKPGRGPARAGHQGTARGPGLAPPVTRHFPGTNGGRGRRGPPAGTRPAGSAKSGPPSSPGPASARSGPA